VPSLIDRLRDWNRRLKNSTHTYMVVVAVVVGLLAGLAAVGFRELIDVFQHVFWNGDILSVAMLEQLPWWHIVLAPAVGGLLVGLIVHYGAPEAKGHGVPEVMEAIALKGGRIRPRVVAIKALASGLCLASGGSVGREGPIVQIGAAIGSTVGQFLQLGTRRLRTIAGCGAAAGIAATFNAPIAGLIFVVEVLLRDLRFTQFSPIVVASVVATAVSRELIEDVPAFEVPEYALVTPLELPVYALLGLLAAGLAVAFVRFLYFSEDRLESLRIHPGVLAMLGGAAVGGIALLFPEVLGNGYEGIETALLETPPWKWLVLILGAKFVAVCLTLGTGGSGGVFAPSLFLGAAVGGLVGALLNAVFPGAVGPLGAYALVGMGAMVAATTHAPLTAILILFELTGDYRIILPLMIACTIATLCSSRLHPESIYTKKLARRGTHLHAGRDANVLRNIQTSEVMRHHIPRVPANEVLLKAFSRIAHDDEPGYFIEDEDGLYVGVFSMRDLRPVLADLEGNKNLLTVADVTDTSCVPLAREDTLDTALGRLQSAHREVWPVAEGRRLVGAIYLEDILTSYRREVFKRDMAQGMSDALSSEETAVRTIGEFVITEVEAPPRFYGKTLGTLDLRARHGITVLVVKRPNEGDEDLIVPAADTVIQAGDGLLVMGREPAVQVLVRE
jgi:CIC family chloride channel protein